MPSPARWFTDQISSDEAHRHRLRKILVQMKTKFQSVLLADTAAFGRCLILDGEIQSAEHDEFIYHECLVHPALSVHPRPRHVLILGGGEGATAREVLRHPGVHRVTMVDIDGDVVQFCKTHLARWHQGAFSDPRTRLVIGEARKYVLETREQFDIIISDLPTPAPWAGGTSGRGPLAELYSPAFYRRLAARMRPGGILATQAGSGSLPLMDFHASLYRTMKKVFKRVRPYYAFVPSFDMPWAFLIATQGQDPRDASAAQIDRRLGTLSRSLRFYDGQTHEGLFRIPKAVRGRLDGARHLIKEKK